MKQFITIVLVGLLFVSCADKSKENTKNSKATTAEEHVRNGMDGLQNDTLKINTDTVPELSRGTKTSSTEYLLNLLINPLDLQEFKKANGPSNSGTIDGNGLFKPDPVGFYLRFMLFNSGNDSKLSEADRFRKFQIYVYRYGKEIGDFFDTNEVLIGFKCAFENEALKNANLVGRSKNEIKDLFGNDFIGRDSIQIYQNNNRVLSLCFESSKVKWMKYYKLSSPVLEDSIPERLILFHDK